MDSKTTVGTTRTADAYLRDGVIMFDAAGRLSQQSYVLAYNGLLGSTINLMNGTAGLNVAIYTTTSPPFPLGYTAPQPLPSSFGVVLYDRDAYASQKFPTIDPTFSGSNYSTGATPSESDAELWLDTNATPLLINRYNGTLVRGE